MLRAEIDGRDRDLGVRSASSAIAGRLSIAGKDVGRTLPRADEIEVAEFLHQLHGPVDDALQFFVVRTST